MVSNPKSIAEVLAEAEKQKIETARKAALEYAQRKQAATQAVAAGVSEVRKVMTGAAMGKAPAAPARGGSSASAGKARSTAPVAPTPVSQGDDLKDEFDYALEAVEMAKKSLGKDVAGIEKMAVNLLVAKTGVSRDDAPRFVRKAIQYLGR